VDDALVHRPVADERDADPIDPVEIGRERCAGDMGGVRADDTRRLEHAVRRIEQMHVAAPSAIQTVFLASEFRHELADVRSLGDDVTVAPVGPRDNVVRIERETGTDSHRLLADTEVNGPRRSVRIGEGGERAFDVSDQSHSSVHLREKRLVVLVYRFSIHGA